MDNDIEVKVSKPELRLFLTDQRLFPEDKRDLGAEYDLESEYEKTRQNRSPWIYLVLLGAIAFTALSVLAINKIVSAQNEKVTVSVEAFDDLNLRQLLDTVSRIENQLSMAISERNRIDAQYADDIAAAENQRDSDLYTLQSMDLSRAEYDKQSKVIVDQCRRSVSFIDANYLRDTKAIDAKIEELSAQLAAMDSANLEKAQKMQTELDSERRLFALEKESLVEDYEKQLDAMRRQSAEQKEAALRDRNKAIDAVATRYKVQLDELLARTNALDPTFADGAAAAIVEEAPLLEGDSPDLYGAASGALVSEGEMFLVNSIVRKYESFMYLNEKLCTIPFSNSAAAYVRSQRSIANSIGNDTAELLAQMLAARQGAEADGVSYEKLLSSFRYYLDMQLKQSGDSGCVLDCRDGGAIVVYVSPLFADAADGAKAYIFREDDELIGQVVLRKEAQLILAEPESEAVRGAIMAGDRVLIDFSQSGGRAGQAEQPEAATPEAAEQAEDL